MTKSQPTSDQPISTRIIPGLSTTVRHDTSLQPLSASTSTSNHNGQIGSRNESVTQRLQRLRLENRRHQANLLRSSNLTSTNISSHGSIIHSLPIRRQLAENILSAFEDIPSVAFQSFTSPNQANNPRQTNIAGPPPPASWLPTLPGSPQLDLDLPVSIPSSGLDPLPPSLVFRQSILRRSDSTPRFEFSSLSDSCLRRLAFDMSYMGTGASFCVIPELNQLQRQRLFELAAEWSPLDDYSFTAFFPPLILNDPKDHQIQDPDVIESWEEESEPDFLDKTLNLSFCSITISSLSRSIFAGHVLRAPWLTTLKLDHTSQIVLSTSLLRLLENLPLLELSLAAQKLDPSLLPTIVLNRLASSTPSLRTLDLSFNPGWASLYEDHKKPDGISREIGLGSIDWQRRWPSLGRLVLVGNMNISQSKSVSQVNCDRRSDWHSRALKKLFKTRLEKGGKYIECVL
ncbi:uncharacterized protein MELLADRAFT_105837 [Melampsora larici-populina 98AG31]|uniref:Uncharacterized protein n=1 Tax=Melampsora larici-populina (strain 98AG31 / pathotype 3-4-7) TaxID=747676 RepID=F4RJH8_MELLP|nr:uncharacterized protein MELLADRAFT_105837 [Melampsora larici-populina 98AG31]EGG07313.1 hypothetical protein MELLADRAFT_105837 [Melampsora larici-populina 98AG31]